MTRITGLATGLDVDAVVQETMNAYQTKIDAVDQQKMLLEIQQEMYREVITECRDFYDKYFNVGKSDSILLQRNWGGVKFETSNPAVTVTGSAGAEATNYTVEIQQIAKSASYQLSKMEAESKIYINNIEIDLTGIEDNKKKVAKINEALKNENITAKYSEFTQGIVLSTKETGRDKVITIGTIAPVEDKIDKTDLEKDIEEFNTNETSFNIGQKILIEKDSNSDKVNISVDGKVMVSIDKGNGITKEKLEKVINSSFEFKKKGISITENEAGEIFVLENTSMQVETGQNCEAKLTNVDGDDYFVNSASNSITVDGVTFKFNGETTETINITGKTDVTKVKDNIVKFINDYNTLMEKLNTLINEKRDSDYMPLTEAQKEEMTEKQIELWEKKVKTGQLSRDSDLTRIRNAMKSAMSSIVGNLGQSLKSFGITAVSDYSGTKNGTFSIDEDVLTKALENNIEDVMKVFINSSDDTSEKGVLQQLKSIFDKETQSLSGSLLKKAGIEGSATASDNTLSRRIAQYETKISRMEKLFATKQQALYSKYARIETLMNKLNSQSSYLSSMFSS